MLLKIKRFFIKKEKYVVQNEEIDKTSFKDKASLLSICVLPDFRGKNVAQQLLDEYHKMVLSKNRKLCLLSVFTDNVQAIRFYEKNKYLIYKKNSYSIVYAK